MSEEFRFIRDFKKINWLATLQVNAIRTEAAGILWLIFMLFMGGGWKSLMYIFWPIIYLIFGLPIGLVISWLSGLGVPFIGWFGAIISASVVIGDPITYLLHKKRPDLVPVKRYRLFNWVLVIFVLEDQEELVNTDEKEIVDINYKEKDEKVISIPQAPILDINENKYEKVQIGTQIQLTLRNLGENVYFHPLKEKETIELLDVPFFGPSNVRCAFVVGGGDGTMIAALSDIENYWGIDPDERSDNNLLGDVTFSKLANGQWSYLSSSSY